LLANIKKSGVVGSRHERDGEVSGEIGAGSGEQINNSVGKQKIIP
jgi:hypothetical protein